MSEDDSYQGNADVIQGGRGPALGSAARGAGKVRGRIRASPAPEGPAASQRQARSANALRLDRLSLQIAITQQAFDAIVAAMQFGSVGFENKTNERGERLIWL